MKSTITWSWGFSAAVQQLLNYEPIPDDVDQLIGSPGYVAITARGQFSAAHRHQRLASALAVPHEFIRDVLSRRR
jgi:hypothetical protein